MFGFVRAPPPMVSIHFNPTQIDEARFLEESNAAESKDSET